MDSLSRAEQLPAQRLDAAGRAHVDQRAVIALALPLMANSAVQIVLNLTDMWFMGRISTKALAAVGAVAVAGDRRGAGAGGAGTACRTLVAQNFGARRYRARAQAVWTSAVGRCMRGAAVRAGGAARHLNLAPSVRSAGRAARSAFWFRVSAEPASERRLGHARILQRIGRPRVTLLSPS